MEGQIKMKITFRTNLDNYQSNKFPDDFTNPPRIGDSVSVKEEFIDFYEKKKLPTSLIVVDVIWFSDKIVCELWYKQIDIDRAKIFKINLF